MIPLLFDAATLRSFLINPWVNGLILGLMVLGVFISFRVLNIADLSVEGIIPMVGMLSVVLISLDVNPWLVLLISMAAGALCGMINAAMMTYLKIPPLLSGIIVMALTFGIAIMINSMRSGSVNFDPNEHLTVFNWLKGLLGNISRNPVYLIYASYLSYILVTAVILAAVWAALYFFFGTELGMSIRAAGKNVAMAKANGINVNLMNLIALAISGALIGLAASLYGQNRTMALPTDGQGMIVIALSSLFLGEIIVGTRSFKRSLIASLVGSLVYWYIIQLLQLLDTTGFMLSIYKALLLVLILCLQMGLAKIKKKTPKRPKTSKPGDRETKTDETPSFKASFIRHCMGERTVC